MKIVFVSNFLNHHQTVLCDILYSKVDSFYFVSGYKGKGSAIKKREDREYVIYYKDNAKKAKEVILSADAVIFGNCPDWLVELRMKENKLSFIYSERIFKKSILQILKPENYKKIKQRFLKYKDKNLYVLAASAFLSYDLSHYNFPTEKVLKWGYFPHTDYLNDNKRIENSILFTGRFFDWKHADTVIETAKLLKKDNMDFKVNIIGDGPEKESLEELVKKYNLNDCVEFLGIREHEDVIRIMNEHEIFMFTSSSQEGWGAVLNEAMASGCAVVASSVAGATPFLVKHNQNGKVYKYGNDKNAYNAVKELLQNREEIKRFGKNANKTITDEYDGQIAIERFIEAVKEFNDTGTITPHEGGVLSQANIIKNNWFKS